MKRSKYLIILALSLCLTFLAEAQEQFDVRKIQFGFFPPLSTNGLSNTHTINSHSYNVIGELSKGNTVLEISSIFNINTSFIRGIQIAGVINYSDLSKGAFQVVGVANINNIQAGGVQLAGVLNFFSAGEADAQIAGCFNIAGGQSSLQIGTINYAGTNNGLQIGVINIAKKSRGASIGLLNFILDGKNEIEIGASDGINTFVNLKMGTNPFYNILSFGKNFVYNDLYAVGYGIGCSVEIKNSFAFQIELAANMLTDSSFRTKNLNLLNQLNLYFSKNVSKHFALYGGPKLYGHLSHKNIVSHRVAPYELYSHHFTNYSLTSWIGFSLGARVCL